jgi:predicted HD superfamily hydrolase involved in NAD metabolism
MANNSLIHAKLGAKLAKEKYGVLEKEILSAIENHTTGKPDMTMLEKIVFSADYIEPGRKRIPGLDEIRNIIFIDIDEAVYLILKNTLEYLKTENKCIDQTSQWAFAFYKSLHDKKEKGE